MSTAVKCSSVIMQSKCCDYEITIRAETKRDTSSENFRENKGHIHEY